MCSDLEIKNSAGFQIKMIILNVLVSRVLINGSSSIKIVPMKRDSECLGFLDFCFHWLLLRPSLSFILTIEPCGQTSTVVANSGASIMSIEARIEKAMTKAFDYKEFLKFHNRTQAEVDELRRRAAKKKALSKFLPDHIVSSPSSVVPRPCKCVYLRMTSMSLMKCCD